MNIKIHAVNNHLFGRGPNPTEFQKSLSPYINRFTQPDSVIPSPANPQSWNRYAYVINNPILYNDPTGHDQDCGPDNIYCGGLPEPDLPAPMPLPPGNGGGRGGGNSPCGEDDDLCWMNQNDNDDEDDGDDDWDGRCDRWHRRNCLPWPDPSPSAAPDYISFNLCYFLICGQVVRDYYNNWYWGVGPGLSSGLSYSLNAGWLLQAGRSEEAIQNFTLKWSAFGGVASPVPHPLAGLGGAATWGDPSLTRPFDYHDVGLEVLVGNVGGAGGLLYDSWIYDSGDPTPWFWQDKDGENNINLQQ